MSNSSPIGDRIRHGGCMFALVDQEHAEEVSLALQNLPVHIYSTTIVEDGISIREKKV